MQSKSESSISIIGGTYRELCTAYKDWDHIYGSGLRALLLYQQLNYFNEISFNSACDRFSNQVRHYYCKAGTRCNFLKSSDVRFRYEHPFRVSEIYPRPDFLYAHKQTIEVCAENVLLFGMIDADFKIEGKNVVYDPQTCVLPHLFSENSKADKLIYVLNMHEACLISGHETINDIKDFFFVKEECYALVIKMGALGAYLFENREDIPRIIPLYKTPRVFSIGSGDVFTAYFSHEWFRGESLYDAAISASKAVAYYSANDGKIDAIPCTFKNFNFPPLIIKEEGQIYLAGPFFNFTQRWIVNEFYQAINDERVAVFSPLHNVGIGDAHEVTDQDIKGLENSKVILAIVDGLDSGTLFEIGYAIAKKKKVIAYVQNESKKSLQMLEGTHCDLEDDFTTALYKACWYAKE